MQKLILRAATGIVVQKLQCSWLALNPGLVVLGSLVGLSLMPTNPAISQSPTFYGVPISQKVNVNSDFAVLVKKLTKKYFESSGGRVKGSTYRLGQWLLVPGGEGNYATYEAKRLSLDITNSSDKPIKIYVIYLLTDTTTDKPESFQFSVDCTENKIRLSSWRTYSASGETIDRQLVDRPLVASPNQYIQNLMNEVCRLGT
jgi:hypothetical protein